MRPAIDFDKLRQFLSREIVEGRESYEFTWVGKRGAIAEAGKPTTQTLRPDLEESVDFDKSENVFITGDNLEVLKVLQESYLGKIDMIYIDPPYNTGKDFVYRDRSQLSEKELEELSKQRNENDELLFKFETNAKQSAKYHSDWLNMMYPRLVLARNLLKDSGVIFISIDDNEQANLKAICDEIFGEENFVTNFCWHNNKKGRQMDKFVKNSFENILLYSKNINELEINSKKVQVDLKKYDQVDSISRYKKGYPLHNGTASFHIDNRPNLAYSIYYNPFSANVKILDEKVLGDSGYEIVLSKEGQNLLTRGFVRVVPKYNSKYDNQRVWRWSAEKFLKEYKSELIFVQEDQGYYFYQKERIDDEGTKNQQFTNYIDIDTSNGKIELNRLFDNKTYFDFPKTIKLIKMLCDIKLGTDSVILDFFAGSATTADAVMQLNAEDGGNRKYILCTLDEQVADKSAAKEAGYETIDQISRERIRRAAKKIQEEHPERVGKQDFGFRAYKLDTSNFKDISQTPDSFTQEDLFDSVSNIKDGRTDLDLLLQIMLTWGMELSLPIAKTQIDGTDVYNVADGALIACFADEISESVLRQIAKEEPLRAVFKDESFANSAAKINLGQIFKEKAPNTKVKVV
ncbi:site-specific DNA-methyltransferase [Streptococcus parasuis]|uniref:site-specific DNA-methyltransferase n=1 Tax=Streptococcus parasuis TaxID=1501662 RepID=UPI0020A808DD|nr:site-specific DNA-methyltransferase [Streptococcus parasuis]